MEVEPFVASPSNVNGKTNVSNLSTKRGWKFDNPCLMCKKGTSKIVGDAEVPCTCGGKPSKKRNISLEAFNPFAISASTPSFVPPKKLEEPREVVRMVEPIAQEPIPQMFHLPRQPPPVAVAQQQPAQYYRTSQRPVSFSNRPIPTAQNRYQSFPVFAQQRPEPQLMMQQLPVSNPVQIPQTTMRSLPQYMALPTPQPQQQPQLQPNPNKMGAVLYNILDEMKQLSVMTQQLKEEHNTFLYQIEKLKQKNRDMQDLIDVGAEPLDAFVEVARADSDPLASDLLAMLEAQQKELAKTVKRVDPIASYVESLGDVPFIITDSVRPFMVFRPVNLSLTTKELSQICDQNRLGKSAKDKLRLERVAANDSFCKLLNFSRDDLLQTKDPKKIIRSKHKKHFFLKVASHLLKPSNTPVSPILPFEPRFRTKEGTIIFTSSKMQIFYNETGSVSFFIVCIETITKTHVPRYLEVKQRQQAKHAQREGNNNNLQQQQQQQQAHNLLYGSVNASSKKVADHDEEDESWRYQDELDEEEEAFLDGGVFYFPPTGAASASFFSSSSPAPRQQQQQQQQQRQQQQLESKLYAGCFDSPVGSPTNNNYNNNNYNDLCMNNSRPASPLMGVDGGIAVGTLREFETSDDYSWLLSQQPDSFSVVL